MSAIPSNSASSTGVASGESDTQRYLTVEEFAWRVRRTAKTAYNWINKGIIGADDGVVTIQGRIFIDWPTYSVRQIKKLGLRPKELPTLGAFAEQTWLPLKTLAVKRSTYAYYSDVYRSLVSKSEIAQKHLGALSIEEVDSWRLWVDQRRTSAGEKLTVRRRNMARDVLCQILGLARQYYGIDLMSSLKVFRHVEGVVESDEADHDDEIRPYSEEEVERIIEGAEDWERSVVTVYFSTGLRRGELIGLTWSNVFLERDYLIVVQTVGRYGKTKPKTSGSRRKVQFGARVREELLAQRRRIEFSSAYVFPNQSGHPLNPHWLGQVFWPRILERAGVEYRPIGQTRPHLCCPDATARCSACLAPAPDGAHDASDADSPLLAIHPDS